LRPHAEKEPFLTLDFKSGAAAQVDWADFGFALPGCPRRVSAFVMVMCYSRMLYLEFTLSQAMGSFLRCMERALRFFGGSTTVDIFDNMKTVVLSHTPIATVFNSTFLSYARARQFGAIACNVCRGNEKGLVERPIGFVRERFWPGCRPSDLLDINVKAAAWRDTFANNRVHDITGKVPALVFEHDERRALRPIQEVSFNTDDVDTVTVSKTFRVRFDRNLYYVAAADMWRRNLKTAHAQDPTTLAATYFRRRLQLVEHGEHGITGPVPLGLCPRDGASVQCMPHHLDISLHVVVGGVEAGVAEP
jgi:hypothetical protein